MDNSLLPYFPPIRTQGNQSSCTAWAVGYYYSTYTQAVDEGYTVSGGDNTHICSPGFLYNLVDGGMDGGSSVDYVLARVLTVGRSSWAQKPYSASDYLSWPSEAAWLDGLQNRLQATHNLDGTSGSGQTAIKQLLANGQLVVSRFDVHNTFYTGYPTDHVGINNKVYYYPDGTLVGGHAITLVGYDDNKSYVDNRDGLTHYGAFLVANSWGTTWGVTNSSGAGTKGYFWVAYTMFTEATFGPTVYYADDRPHYRSKLYAAVGINHPDRNMLRLRGKITGASLWRAPEVIYYDGGAGPRGHQPDGA